ncbi:cytidine deaminase [Confluentibacter sediminis]|uniref:cytidine deaminase n=1 Tax=Confluentibacter sediminis TaxID=2219045 RepID=UPI000DAEF9E8|nr:cytidine deaminase [Confluentibacter sediminis]
MKELKIESIFQVYDDLSELPKEIFLLMNKAVETRNKAYAPYSKFRVGTALLLDNGEIITGNNQENVSYPSGLCAERTAIYYAGSQYPDSKILKMAITGASSNQKTKSPISPCGACRQAIAEYEVKQESPIEIYFMGEIGPIMKSNSLQNLLPLVFDKAVL